MSIRASLEALGLPSDAAQELAARVASPPPGVLDGGDAKDAEASPAKAALVAALVASLETRRFAAALRALLDRLAHDEAGLSPYDAARFKHLFGLAAWRLDDSALTASRALNESIRLLAKDGSERAKSYTARVHDAFGQLLHQQGMLGEARRELEAALRIREQHADEAGTAITLGNLGRLCMDLGDFDAAAKHLTRDLELVAKISPAQTRVRAQLLSHLAHARLVLGQIDEAERSIAESEALAKEDDDAPGQVFAAIARGHVLLRRGDAKGADALATEAQTAIRPLDLPPMFRSQLTAAALRLAGDAKAKLGDHAGAADAYRTARKALIEVSGASPIEHAEILRGLADALAALDDAAESAQSLRLALRHLDATAADAMRRAVEATLKQRAYDSWLLHSAGRFIGQRHIEFLLSEAGQEGFRGERRHVATLFSDIRGFTTMSERLAPDELILLLNDFLTQMTRCIEREDGMVDKFIGDAVMAVFTVAKESRDATHAIRAALAMKDELERFNRRLVDLPALSIGVGVHCGDVVAGLIGSPQKREYTVIGDVVNTASRLEGMTKQLGASILVTEEVVKHADAERFLLRPLGAYSPKGRRTPIRVYDVMGERDRSPASAAIAKEIERVYRALDRFESGDFREAASIFQALVHDAHGTAKAHGYELLQHHAEKLQKAPPGDDWQRSITLTEK